jgi:flagellin
MGLTVNTNIAALNAYRNLSSTQGSLSKSLEKLSSGYRINRAADDAAGLAISEGLKSQVGGLTVAARNAQDGISVVQTAEGALTEVHSILQRLRDLAVQAANDSNNGDARANITAEATSLVQELDRIGKSTNFNGTPLLDGTTGTLYFQVGADGDANSQIAVDMSSVNVSGIATTLNASSGVTFTGVAASTYADSLTFTASDAASNTAVATVDLSGQTFTTYDEVAAALNDNSTFSANFVASTHYSVAGVADGVSVVSTKGLVVDNTDPGNGASGATGTPTLDFTSHSSSQAAITLLDTQINSVSTARAQLGAYQNRFEHTINSVNVAIENLSASESRIADTDMAQEMVNFTRAQILQQAGTAMLAQANQLPQSVLKLLQ